MTNMMRRVFPYIPHSLSYRGANGKGPGFLPTFPELEKAVKKLLSDGIHHADIAERQSVGKSTSGEGLG
jgi:hypothetical protein